MRNAALDTARGAGIALMILDHAAVVFELPSVVRDFTRVALPLFMVTAGYLFAGRLGRRYLQVVAAALLTWPFAVELEIAFVHVLAVFALVYPLLMLPPWAGLLVVSVGLLQAVNWPIPWAGYQPGYVFAFLFLGRLVRLSRLSFPGSVSFRPLAFAGRAPLALYVGHLLIFSIILYL